MFLRFALAMAIGVISAGCGEPLCETGEESSCLLPTPCEAIQIENCGGFAEVRTLSAGDPVPLGDDALASPGDFLLQNDRFTLVIDGLGHPHYFAASGGTLLDAFADGTGDGDRLLQVAQAVGLGAADGVVYDRYRILDTDRGAALQLRGSLVGNEDHRILTRYEIRSCEPGVRVRTEVYNRGTEDALWSLGDLWLFGERGHLPFAPHETLFEAEELTELLPTTREVPFLATIPPTAGGSVYGCVPCDTASLTGFVRSDVSMLGKPRRSVGPGDREVFERFVIVTGGGDAAAAADVAYELRRQLFGHELATLRGRVAKSDTDARDVRATVVVESTGVMPDDPALPVTQVTPGADGSFEVRVPAGRDFDVVAQSFGRESDRVAVIGGDEELDAGLLDDGPSGVLRVSTTLDGAARGALVALIPEDAATRDAVEARRFGGALHAPLLGAPSAGTPAGHRFLTAPSSDVRVPPGEYRVVATHGPFATLAAEVVTITPGGTANVTLASTSLDLLPPGTLSVDLHAHGPASFDATAPVASRLAAFVAVSLDLVAMTDHDILVDYQEAAAGLEDEIRIVTGLETTGQRPFSFFPDGPAATIGRFAFLPLTPVATGPWRGAPADENVEPGVLFTRVSSAGFELETGLVQLLRPWGQPILGRHVGFPRAIGLDVTRTLPAEFDGTAQSLFRRTPAGALFANDAFHTVEVLSGVEPESFVAQRTFWHYLLAENVVRAITAGGGSHGIGDSIAGAPRTIVTPASDALSDVLTAIQNGRALATNGPIIDLTMLDADGVPRRPSTTAFVAPASPRVMIRVLAAPWIPVEEVRVIVNGNVLVTLRDELVTPTDPTGVDGVVRFEGEVDVTPGLALEFGDAFVVVEAGAPLTPAADLDCDGVPDTGDNDGDGDIDPDDVGIRASARTPAPMVTTMVETCLAEAGPLRRTPAPADPSDPRHVFSALIGFAPIAVTNPLLLDVDGGGYAGVPRGLTP